MKKEMPTFCEMCIQFGHPKQYCRSKIVEETFASTAKNPTRQEIRKYAENKMEATIQNKMKLDEYDAYTAKETLG